ncbi:MAG: bifunctional riboflavin kinase/FAD synthetase [Nocardioides sp.]|uniref:bifunctional riboflavin kinase/FAD synthetase n=1 Tax=Nocardioides sp. TaxID=35761 RepID=UPI0039E59224
MVLWRSVGEVPADLGRTVVVIGNFDGVHRGHQHVLALARERADAGGLTMVAITFDPHPMAVLRPEHAPTTLTSLDLRAELLEHYGADAVLALPFDRDVAAWSADDFAQRVLVDALHARLAVVGANFRYGRKASGDVRTLADFGAGHDFEVTSIDLDGGPQVWSSTYVRTCLAAGDVEGAAEALGRPYAVRGVVVKGDQRGRELGFPTANVPTDALDAVPPDGVYAGWLTRLDTGERFPGAISVGTNPTFEGVIGRRVETYVLDRTDLDLYGVEVQVEFVERLRGQVAYTGIEPLIEQIRADVEDTRRVLGLPLA